MHRVPVSRCVLAEAAKYRVYTTTAVPRPRAAREPLGPLASHRGSPGPAPGLLAIEGDDAVGWCQVTPRADVPALDRPWRLRAVDDVPVWSISCSAVAAAAVCPRPRTAP